MACSTAASVEKARHLANKYWPEGNCIFVHANTEMPADFVTNPNQAWARYAIVCVSTRLKVGVSMTAKHFHVALLVAATGVGPTSDVLQLIQRVRQLVQLLLYYVIRAGGATMDLDEEQQRFATDQALDQYAQGAQIDRTLLPPVVPAPQPTDYERIVLHVDRAHRADQANFLANIRLQLRRRQMTIQLGGMSGTDPLQLVLTAAMENAGSELQGHRELQVELPPLPPDMDLSGPDLKQRQIDRILRVPDLSHDQYVRLTRAARKRTLDEQAQIDRYAIKNTIYRPDGLLPFAELVEKHVRHHYSDKVERCKRILEPNPAGAAARDEAQMRFPHPLVVPDHLLQERNLARALFCTLPGMTPSHLLNVAAGKISYSVSRKRLDHHKNIILPRQEQLLAKSNLKPSTAKTPIKRIISNFNSALRRIGMPSLTCNRRKRMWTLKTAYATLSYARLLPDQPIQPQPQPIQPQPQPQPQPQLQLQLQPQAQAQLQPQLHLQLHQQQQQRRVLVDPLISYPNRTVRESDLHRATNNAQNDTNRAAHNGMIQADHDGTSREYNLFPGPDSTLLFVNIRMTPSNTDPNLSLVNFICCVLMMRHNHTERPDIDVAPELFHAKTIWRITFPELYRNTLVSLLDNQLLAPPQPITEAPTGLPPSSCLIRRVQLVLHNPVFMQWDIQDVSDYPAP